MLRYAKIVAGACAVLVFVAVTLSLGHYLAKVSNPRPTPASVGSAVLPSSHTAATSTASTTSTSSIATSVAATPATSTIQKISPKTVIPASLPTISTTTVIARELSASGGKLLKSLVNIVCVSNTKGIPSISGTGVIIDSRGVILTAAHVAQLFLLQDYLGTDKVQCLIRTGSPARRAYLAEPIFVSPSWVHANPSTLTTASPTGNGQNDVALLGITGTATSTPLPSSFPAIPLGPSQPLAQESVAIGSYGAQYLSGNDLNYSLYPILVFGSIANRYTYSSGSADLFSIQGSAASQEGSSGGGVANPSGQLIGTITTSSIGGSVQERTLNAVSAGHIRDTYQADMGANLDNALSSHSVTDLIQGFNSQSVQLGQLLYTDVKNAQH